MRRISSEVRKENEILLTEDGRECEIFMAGAETQIKAQKMEQKY